MSTLLINALVRHVDPALGLDDVYLQRPNERITRTMAAIAAGTLFNVSNVTPYDLPMASVVTPGFAVFHNQSLTDKVQVGYTISAVFRPFIELPPKMWTPTWLHAPHTWQAFSPGSPVNLKYAIFEQEP